MAALIAYRQLLAGAFCGVKHLLSLGGVDSHRLFAHNVLSRLQCVNSDEAVTAVGSKNMNDVDGLILKQLFIIGVNRAVGSAEFFTCGERLFFDYVAESDHFDIFEL